MKNTFLIILLSLVFLPALGQSKQDYYLAEKDTPSREGKKM